MKNTIKVFMIIAFVVALGFSFTTCFMPPEEQIVTISGTPTVGNTITARYNRTGFGNFSWELSSTDGAFDWGQWGWWSGGNVTGANNQNYEITTGSVGRYIRASVLTERGNTLYSNVLGPIQPAN
jgi:hypothetical protein